MGPFEELDRASGIARALQRVAGEHEPLRRLLATVGDRLLIAASIWSEVPLADQSDVLVPDGVVVGRGANGLSQFVDRLVHASATEEELREHPADGEVVRLELRRLAQVAEHRRELAVVGEAELSPLDEGQRAARVEFDRAVEQATRFEGLLPVERDLRTQEQGLHVDAAGRFDSRERALGVLEFAGPEVRLDETLRDDGVPVGAGLDDAPVMVDRAVVIANAEEVVAQPPVDRHQFALRVPGAFERRDRLAGQLSLEEELGEGDEARAALVLGASLDLARIISAPPDIAPGRCEAGLDEHEGEIGRAGVRREFSNCSA